jgi:glycine/D-amino acid oxidase-like deaminating enzyme
MQTDVIVVGAGAAGLAAALAAQARGLDVVVLEKERRFGGTSALSGAAIWIPLHDDHGTSDTAEAVLQYLDALAPDPADRPRREAFVAHAATALRFYQQRTALAYTSRKVAPDYHPELPGAVEAGRALDVETYDGRRLGPRLADLRAPLETHLVFGGMMVNRADVAALLGFGRRRDATLHGLKLIGRYLRDRLAGHGRGTRLVVGSALVARLAETLFAERIPLLLDAPVHALTRDANGKVTGVEFLQDGVPRRIEARRAVILATGGYSGDAARSRAERPDPQAPHLSMANSASTGDGATLAEAVGGRLGPVGHGAFFRAPVSLHRPPGAASRHFAHLTLDRAKPGVIAVNRQGRRFTNEADSYHRFGEALSRLPSAGPDAPVAWLIADARALRHYGLGLARPAPAHGGNRRLIRDGYLVQAPSVEALARRLDLPAETLAATIDAHGHAAADGRDPDFGKGESSHNRALGDPTAGPNPCLAPLAEGPFSAVGLYSGDLGTARGLMTDAAARVLDGAGAPISGLYAIGNDMQSIMGGTYPGPGITLGPALVFAWLAAAHIAQDST